MSLKIQETPQAPSYAAANIQVPANIATPQATMNNVKVQQGQLNDVNNLTGGGRRRTRGRGRGRGHRRHVHKTFIRTYKGRQYIPQQITQKGGSNVQEGGQIQIPQVGQTCTGGSQCAGSQNAAFTAIHNQAQASSVNDAYVQSGGRGRTQKKARFKKMTHHKPRHDQSLTTIIAYNIKKVLRKVLA